MADNKNVRDSSLLSPQENRETTNPFANFVVEDIELEDLSTNDFLTSSCSSSRPQSPKPGTSKASEGVRTVPFGSGLAFFMDESDESLSKDSKAVGLITDDESSQHVVAMSLEDSEMIEEDDDEDDLEDQEGDEDAMRDKLTAEYLEGKLSFRDYVREIDSDEGEFDNDYEELTLSSSPTKKTAKTLDEEDVESSDEDEELSEEDDLEKRIDYFSKDLDVTTRQQLGRKKRRLGFRRRQKRLDPALQGLMGEANMRFARGDTDTAIRMCMEVIQQDPAAPEPFQTLATLYDGLGQHEKALQFALIGAHLAPPDADEWCRLAQLSLESGDKQQAATCYKKAVDADPSNISHYLKRTELLEELGELSKAIVSFKKLLANLKENQGRDFLRGTRELARLLHTKSDIESAKDVMELALTKYPEFSHSGDINLLLELLITLKQYEAGLEVLHRHCDARLTSKIPQDELSILTPEQQLQAFDLVVLPDDTPVEIKSKMIVILLNLGAKHLVKELSEQLLTIDVEHFGDILLDVAEAYIGQQEYQESIIFLEKLIKSENWAKAAVWLSYGETLYELGRIPESAEAYQKVVELAPQHHDARRTLSTILHQLGRVDEAIQTLTQDEAEILNPTLLFERCHLLFAEGQMEEFITKTKLLLSRHTEFVRNREELFAVASQKRLARKARLISQVRAIRREALTTEDQPCFEKDEQTSVTDEFELYFKLCEVLFEKERFGELEEVAFSVLASSLFGKVPEILRECEFLALLSAFFNGDSYHAYNFIRELVIKDLTNPKLWNLFNLIVTKADDARHNRFLIRLMVKHPDISALAILNGHNCLVAGTYKYSLGEYMSAFKQDPENPMLALMLGLNFVHMACQKFSARKHSLVVQATAFLNTYVKLRGECQEAFYNIGRAMHQLGILPAATFYYKKALDTKPVLSGDKTFDLSQEAAFNLSLIYKASDNKDLERYYLQKYIVI